MNTPSDAPYRIDPFDDVKLRVAKMKANCHHLLAHKPPHYKRRVREIDWEITREMEAAAADPRHRDDLVDTRVTAAVRWQAPKADVEAMLNTPVGAPHFDAQVVRNSGDLAALVQAAVRGWAYTLEFPELCDQFFSVGAVCTHVRAARLCCLLHAEYAHEVRTGALVVARRHHGFHFPDVYTTDDAVAYVRKQSRTLKCG